MLIPCCCLIQQKNYVIYYLNLKECVKENDLNLTLLKVKYENLFKSQRKENQCELENIRVDGYVLRKLPSLGT